MSQESTDLYRMLGVSPSATQEEIRRAYHTMVKLYHPDRNGGRQGMFLQICEAYRILSDPEQRVLYDVRRLKDMLAVKLMRY